MALECIGVALEVLVHHQLLEREDAQMNIGGDLGGQPAGAQDGFERAEHRIQRRRGIARAGGGRTGCTRCPISSCRPIGAGGKPLADDGVGGQLDAEVVLEFLS
jgi:hypothetical protein